MSQFHTEPAQAVIFFDGNRLTREMLFSEFEAILDGFVPVVDLASQTAQVVYLRVAPGLAVEAAVFFTLTFDAEGMADKRWNIPLDQLAENSAHGPDLGAGPIRLACASQCCIAWHQQQLWDPDMAPQSNHFTLIKKSIQRNRLGLPAKVPESIPVLGEALPSSSAEAGALRKQLEARLEADFRNRLAQKIKEQRLHISTLKGQHELALDRVKLEYLRRFERSRQELSGITRELKDEQARSIKLKGLVDGQADKIKGMREYFELKVTDAKSVGQQELDELKQHYLLEMEARIESEVSTLREQLQMREVELMYRNTQLSSLQEEVARLQSDKQSLLENSGNQMLSRLSQQGLNFVTFKAGVGHITVPADEVAAFTESPDAYVAKRSGVSEEHFASWSAHYNSPVCRALVSGGECCGDRVDRVEKPSDFHVGETDRCLLHCQSPSQFMNAVPQSR